MGYLLLLIIGALVILGIFVHWFLKVFKDAPNKEIFAFLITIIGGYVLFRWVIPFAYAFTFTNYIANFNSLIFLTGIVANDYNRQDPTLSCEEKLNNLKKLYPDELFSALEWKLQCVNNQLYAVSPEIYATHIPILNNSVKLIEKQAQKLCQNTFIKNNHLYCQIPTF